MRWLDLLWLPILHSMNIDPCFGQDPGVGLGWVGNPGTGEAGTTHWCACEAICRECILLYIRFGALAGQKQVAREGQCMSLSFQMSRNFGPPRAINRQQPDPSFHVGQKQGFTQLADGRLWGLLPNFPTPLSQPLDRKQTKCEVSWGGNTSGSTCLMLARKGPSCGGLCSQRDNIEVPTLARFCL